MRFLSERVLVLSLAVTMGLGAMSSSYAHTASDFSFRNGLIHPVFGTDHFLAMLSVGIVSALIGGTALWRVPSMFVLSMIVGGWFGILNLDLLAMDAGLIDYYVSDVIVEIVIGLSVILFGLAIFRADAIGERLAWISVFSFGLFHGYAHGMEMPTGAVPFNYVGGFVVGTIAIHVGGLGIGWLSGKSKLLIGLLRACAIVAVVAGVYFVISALG